MPFPGSFQNNSRSYSQEEYNKIKSIIVELTNSQKLMEEKITALTSKIKKIEKKTKAKIEDYRAKISEDESASDDSDTIEEKADSRKRKK